MATTNPILAANSSGATAIPVNAGSSDRVAEIQAALEATDVRIQAQADAAQTALKSSQQATDIIKTAVSDITTAKSITQGAEDIAALEVQNKTIESFENAGGSKLQMELTKILGQNIEQVNVLQAEKLDIVDDEITGIGIIDAAINRVRARGVDAELAATQKAVARTSQNLSAFAQATQDVNRQNALTAKTLNEGTIAANARSIVAEGKIKEQEAELKSIHSNAVAMDNLTRASKAQADSLLSMYRLEGEAEQREVQREKLVHQREAMAHEKEMWKTQLPAAKISLEQAQVNLERSKKLGPTQIAAAELQLERTQKAHNDQLARESRIVNSIQQAQAAAGVSVEDRETIIYGSNQGGELGRKYDRLLIMSASPNRAIGNTPADSKESLAIIAPNGNYKETKATRMLDDIEQAQAAYYQSQLESNPRFKVPKDAETLKSDYNRIAQEVAKRAQADIKFGDKTNPYHAPPMASIATVRAVQEDVFYQKVLAPTQLAEADPDMIMKVAIAAIESKIVTPEQAAAGIETIYESAALLNNTQDGGYERVSLPSQTVYKTSIKRSPTAFEQLKASTGSIINPYNVASQLGLASSGLYDTITEGDLSAETLLKGEQYVETYQTKYTTVDLMDITSVRDHLVKEMSASGVKIDKKGGK